jgi:5-bromo-4-chloroindolyl phosphate hydrolysis protein
MDTMIKNEIMSDQDIQLLREQFKEKYVKMKGWDLKTLTTEQMIEITSQKGWKTPGLILS